MKNLDQKNPLLYDGLLYRDENTGKIYRIVSIQQGLAFVIQMYSQNLVLLYHPLSLLESGVNEKRLTILYEELPVFDFDNLSEANKAKYLENKDICDTIFQTYSTRLMDLKSKKSKPEIKELEKKYGVSQRRLIHRFTLYLQSGRTPFGLLDGRSTSKRETAPSNNPVMKAKGRPPKSGAIKLLTDKDIKNFEAAKRNLKNKKLTINGAYHEMIRLNYSTKTKAYDLNGNETTVILVMPDENIPSEKQFRYWLSKNSSRSEMRRRTASSSAVYNNNNRVFTGTVRTGVLGPGHRLECDAQEMDIALISAEYSDGAVGRPILYAMIDDYSQMVLAVSLAMDNNSVVGLTNCFINLIEDKESLLKKYGATYIDIAPNYSLEEIWPTGIRPQIMRYDNGSDFVSNDIQRMLNALGISAEFNPPASGSYKPLVENFFRQIKTRIDDALYRKGLITQDYGSKHHKEACLSFEEAYHIILDQVIYHNVHILDGFVKSPEMKAMRVVANPVEIWKYGCLKLLSPSKFSNYDQVLYDLLLPAKGAKINRRGIHYSGLSYLVTNDADLTLRMEDIGEKKEPFECRFDPRNVFYLYYLKDGKLLTAELPDDPNYGGYYGMSKKRYDQLEKIEKETRAKEKVILREQKVRDRGRIQSVVNKASKNHSGINEISSLKENRQKEKERISALNSVDQRFPNMTPGVESEKKHENIVKDKCSNSSKSGNKKSRSSFESFGLTPEEAANLSPEEKRKLVIQMQQEKMKGR